MNVPVISIIIHYHFLPVLNIYTHNNRFVVVVVETKKGNEISFCLDSVVLSTY